ncbi:MAG: methyltransferase domain-containing protein [Solirubrobacteraceae bacterium]
MNVLTAGREGKHPLALYGEGLLSPSPRAAQQQVRLREGTLVPLPLERYLDSADATDKQLLRDLEGPVLDIGCGPGRHLHALALRGVFALGVDLSPVAVELARGRGVRVIAGSIFDELPGIGTWRTALLLDGNIGIGGDPARLLERVGMLLSEDGELLVELDPPESSTSSTLARIETRHEASSWFPWARVSIRDLDSIARAGGFRAIQSSSRGGRWFARMRRAH